MSADELSARRSGRVVEPLANPDVRGGQGTNRAPEGLARTQSLAAAGAAGAEGSGDRRTRRAGRRRLGRLDRDLSPRERAILTDLARFRLLTTAQLQALHFTDHASELSAARICRRVLARLHDLRCIDHLERRVGGIRAGSASYVWRLGPVGDRLLRQGTGVRRRFKEPSARYLDHCLAVAGCYVTAVETARAGWFELVHATAEPDCWLRFLGPGGVPEVLKPDLALVTAVGDYEDHWFIELDRATESLPTIERKCAQYLRARRTGRLQAERGVFPYVLWVVPDDARAAALAPLLADDLAVFRLTTVAKFADALIGGAA